ncbi:MAG TPA: hypothetical protein VGQ14_01410 [Candidatus Eisenbacteria bacterium]|jgi:hypothetical protein|nr:hypothetical protein [Candidatus Eisenbacteria bacterium]
MRLSHVTAVLSLCFVLAFASTACQKSQTQTSDNNTGTTTEQQATTNVQVERVDLGKHVGNDNQITDHSETFTPNETVYATVVTQGSATTAELKTRWTFQDGQVVDEVSRTIAPSGGAATEFHVSKPDGLPVGKYRVEVFLNGSPAATKEFEVKRV